MIVISIYGTRYLVILLSAHVHDDSNNSNRICGSKTYISNAIH